MSLEEIGIKDVTPKNSVGMIDGICAEVACDGSIVYLNTRTKHVGTMFGPKFEFMDEYGDFLLHDSDNYIRVQKVMRA